MPLSETAWRSTKRWLLLGALLLIGAELAIRIVQVHDKPDGGVPDLTAGLLIEGQEATPRGKPDLEAAAIQEPATPASEELPATPASGPAAPHRAPAALRQQDRQRMQDDPDLGAYANELKARADSGDADAAMALSDLLSVCQRASLWTGEKTSLTPFDQNLYGVIGLSADQLAGLDAARRSLGTRCATWPVSDGVNRSQLAESWAAKAAVMGHPGARLSAQARTLWTDTPGADALERGRQMGLELLRQRDPLDLLRHAHTLSLLSPYQRGAFVMAACLLDTRCAADPLAYGRESVEAGAYPGFPNYLTLNFLGPRDRWISMRQAGEIVSLWQTGRFDLILPAADSSSSGGGG
jgi:hypothetical protein